MVDFAKIGTDVPDPRNTGKSPPVINGLQTEINHPTSPLISRKTRQRHRTEKAAIQILDSGIKLSAQKRREAIERIRASPQPRREAQRLIRTIHKAGVQTGGELDLSVVQELRVILIRRDLGLWPPQSTMLADLELSILEGMATPDFKARAAVIFSVPQALPLTFRKQELWRGA